MQVLPDRMQNRPMDKLSNQEDLVRAFKRAIDESREASKSEIAEIDRNWQYYLTLKQRGFRGIPSFPAIQIVAGIFYEFPFKFLCLLY